MLILQMRDLVFVSIGSALQLQHKAECRLLNVRRISALSQLRGQQLSEFAHVALPAVLPPLARFHPWHDTELNH